MRILIIDDCPMTRLTLRSLLESSGFTVSEAEDGGQIVTASCPVKAQLVLCDIFMPGRDGLEVIRELRRKSPATKIIAMSGGAFEGRMDLLRTALHLGADEVLYKPISEKMLLEAVRRVAQKPTLQESAVAVT